MSSEKESNHFRSSQVVVRMPIIKGSVVSYTVENGAVHFKIFAFKDQVSMWSVKKTYQDFVQLDSILESKYVEYIKRGILVKGELPKKEECNFSNLPSIELVKNQLKTYLEILSNQPPTKINSDIN
jgi:hypothetical protein